METPELARAARGLLFFMGKHEAGGDLILMGRNPFWRAVQARSGLMALALLAVLSVLATAALAAPGGGDRGTRAHASKAPFRFVTEKAELRLASAPALTIKEKGWTKGTWSGTVVATFTSYSVTRGSFTMTAYVHGGTLSLAGPTHDHVSGATGYAEGTARIAGGTGIFAHVTGRNLQFRSVVNRRNFYTKSEFHGQLSL